ncbi:MAG TPA: class F sortase [Actinomycetospora sp.]|nr:class F sortase [Actinomycetospora sp.]
MAESRPQRVQIPAIAVDSAVMGLGLRADRRMEVPPGGFPAGWYSRGPTPGEVGPAVLAGHVDWAGHAGVFARLHDLEPQDEVEVTREDRTVAVFRVTRVDQFPKDAFPTQRVYGNLDRPGLRLITCGGELDRQARSYEDNIVVFADFVGTRHT